MSRLIIVSNRVASPNEREAASAGGLATALQHALSQRSGLWLGWSGKAVGDASMLKRREIKTNNIDYILLDLTQEQVQNYYHGFSNRLLWPLCHYRLDLVKFEAEEFKSYIEVNRLFAENLLNLMREDDVIWVHDYHLLPLASELRQLGVKNPIGFFLHIPFPCPDIFVTAPPSRQLLQAMCSYDLLGFQSQNDLQNFKHALKAENIATEIDENKYRIFGHELKTGVFPASIDTAGFAKLAAEASDIELSQRLIIGVDRLDYSKGILERMQAYKLFLSQHTNLIEKVKFLQITPRSRTDLLAYKQLRQEVAKLAGNINGQYGTVQWAPMNYINKAIKQSELSAIYKSAIAALVTPLRDGMNLVAKEYVAAQHPEDPGVLIISRFAGAADSLTGALIVNPYDTQNVANALSTAISMNKEERIARWQPMQDYLLKHDASNWCENFLTQLSPKPLHSYK